MKKRLALPVLLVAVMMTALACDFTSLVPTATANTVPTLAADLQPVSLTQQEERLTSIYEQFSPGVVSILTSTSQGSGWVYDSDGHIVTNNHVVEGETRVEVDFASGYKTYGDVIGTDAYADLAVIKVDAPASELFPLPLGDSDTLQVGQTVIAIGNPFGLSGTMTTGIISALARALPSGTVAPGGGYFSNGDIIQTDAALNPGNSGGPLLNLDGEVIGINSAIRTTGYTDTGEPVNSGIGFAISVNTIKRIVPSLIENGRFDYPYLGLSAMDDLTLQVIEQLGLTQTTGAYVTSVIPGGPAEQAGVLAGNQEVTTPGYQGLYAGGDLIVAADGQPIQLFDDLLRYLLLHKAPGETIVLTVLRGGEQMDIEVVLGTRP
ncbi:MAG: trypsin-like peptidase domain-containing protein [Chloroflexi bacterium]|nr:trypsin-like peptidase domain-containing protein [Chloroflexota bacterium]